MKKERSIESIPKKEEENTHENKKETGRNSFGIKCNEKAK